MKNCEYCDSEYEAKRSTSRYCSAKCRKLAFQQTPPENAKDENGKSGTLSMGTVTPVPPTMTVTPEGPRAEVPENYGLEDCTCRHCQQTRKTKTVLNHGPYKGVHELDENEVNRVSLPGDVDYTEGPVVCDECVAASQVIWESEPGAAEAIKQRLRT